VPPLPLAMHNERASESGPTTDRRTDAEGAAPARRPSQGRILRA